MAKKYIAETPLMREDRSTVEVGGEIELEDDVAKILLQNKAIKEIKDSKSKEQEKK